MTKRVRPKNAMIFYEKPEKRFFHDALNEHPEGRSEGGEGERRRNAYPPFLVQAPLLVTSGSSKHPSVLAQEGGYEVACLPYMEP